MNFKYSFAPDIYLTPSLLQYSTHKSPNFGPHVTVIVPVSVWRSLPAAPVCLLQIKVNLTNLLRPNSSPLSPCKAQKKGALNNHGLKVSDLSLGMTNARSLMSANKYHFCLEKRLTSLAGKRKTWHEGRKWRRVMSLSG